MLFSYNKYTFLMNFIHYIKTSVTSCKTGAILCISIGVLCKIRIIFLILGQKYPFRGNIFFL